MLAHEILSLGVYPQVKRPGLVLAYKLFKELFLMEDKENGYT